MAASFIPLAWIALSAANWPDVASIRFSPDAECRSGPVFQAQVAKTQEQRTEGLSGRTKPMASGEAMIFVWDRVTSRSFWMKETHVPLTISFFAEDGKLLSAQDMPVERDPSNPTRQYTETGAVKAAVETAQGASGIRADRAGTVLCVESPSES